MSEKRERRLPTQTQTKEIHDLFDSIPVSYRYDWNSPQGQVFIAAVRELADRGVPASWLAEELELHPNQLYVLLSRYREGAA